MADMNDSQRKNMMSLVVVFLQDIGFDRSSQCILSEIKEKLPALEPDAHFLQQRTRQRTMEKLVSFLGELSDQEAGDDGTTEIDQEDDMVDEVEGAGEDLELESEVEQHLANELLPDDDEDADDIVLEKAPGSARTVGERDNERENEPGILQGKTRHFDEAHASTELTAHLPSKSLSFEGSEPPADQPKDADDDHGADVKGADEVKLRPANSKWDDNREQIRRVDSERDAGRRVDYVPDHPPPRRFDADYPRRLDGYETQRRDDAEFSRRADVYDMQRRGDGFDQGRRIGGDGFVEHSRRFDNFDARRGDVHDQRRDGFDPRRFENFEQPRRQDVFEPVKRSDGFDPVRRADGLDQSKRTERSDPARPDRDIARWPGHEYRSAPNQYPGDRGSSLVEGGRYPPKVDIRHDYPRSGPLVESPRAPPHAESGPSTAGWNKGGFSGPPPKDWGAERPGERGVERDGFAGAPGGRYPPPPARSMTGDAGRGSGIPAGQGVRAGNSSSEIRWSTEAPTPDARRAYPVRGPQVSVEPSPVQPALARDNVIPRAREVPSSPGDYAGHGSRVREAEGPWVREAEGNRSREADGQWGRGFSDHEEPERVRERKHTLNAVKEPPHGFPGQAQHSNAWDGTLHGARSKSPPRQGLPGHDDRRVMREVVVPASGANFSSQPAAGGNFSSGNNFSTQPVQGNFSAHPKTPTGAMNGKSSVQQPAGGPLGTDKVQNRLSRWGRTSNAGEGSSQVLQQPQGQPQQPVHANQQQAQFQQQGQAQNQPRQAQALPQAKSQQPPYQKPMQIQEEPVYKEPGRQDVSSGMSQPADADRTDLRSNISAKKRKLEDEHSSQFHQAAASAPQNQDMQGQAPDRQRHVVSLKGINSQPARLPESKVQQETVPRTGQKVVRTVRSDDFVSQPTTVTVTGIDVDGHKGSWAPQNKGRGGYNNNGYGRGRGRGGMG